MFVRALPMRCMPRCCDAVRFFPLRRRFSSAVIRAELQRDVVLRSKTPSMLMRSQTRSLFAFLNHAWNRRDDDRIQEVGPDRACAEWVLRCSGSVRFDGRESWTGNYNTLAAAGSQVHVVAIDFTEACVTDEGFDYLQNLKHVRSIKLHKNHDVSDTALFKLSFVKDTLESLQITACSNVSSRGIESLSDFPKLRELYLANLPRIKDLKAMVDTLKPKMQQCEIHIKDADDSAEPAGDVERAAKRK